LSAPGSGYFLRQFAVEFKELPGATEILGFRPRKVSRQRQERRRAAKLALPVIQMSVESALAKLARLPRRIIRVLHWQIRQRRGPSFKKCLIKRRQLGQEYAMRPSVDDDVIEGHNQQMIVTGEPDELDPEHWSVFQI